jgi:L-seryl-tRNA(Ser) seleniumtransferase
VGNALRDVPAVHRFLVDPGIASYARSLGQAAVKAAIDEVLDSARREVALGTSVPPLEALIASVGVRLAHEETGGLVEVLNATGVLLHTNLGRAPLAREALDAVAALGAGYSNLEFDLEGGTRGSRYARVSSLLRQATGAEDALVVNNCAAAMLLLLDTFAKGREVIVSRNQLIEIGGGFRLPDVLERSGARLIEVGTTNKVYLSDFERALGPDTALLLRTHPSNYRIEGFTADVDARDFAGLGRAAGVPTVEDLGSGALVDLTPYGLPHERTVREAVADGIDLIAFSGDKLLGGPQCGIIAGGTAQIARLRANPLLRALRVDKTTLAALAATLRLFLEPGGLARIPLYRMLALETSQLRDRAERLRATLETSGVAARVLATEAFAGGGALPRAALPSAGLAIEASDGDPAALLARLRLGRPAVVARALGRAAVLDLRAVPPEADERLARALAAAAESA